jgi:hypothetical protein
MLPTSLTLTELTVAEKAVAFASVLPKNSSISRERESGRRGDKYKVREGKGWRGKL